MTVARRLHSVAAPQERQGIKQQRVVMKAHAGGPCSEGL